jgi:hypothetical protein
MTLASCLRGGIRPTRVGALLVGKCFFSGGLVFIDEEAVDIDSFEGDGLRYKGCGGSMRFG